MKEYASKDIRNVALIAHSGAGKTSLGEAMLFNAKATSRLGKVDDGTSILDYTPEEIERKYSINLSIAWLEWKNKLINLIDTPGYDDFFGDIISSLRAADACIIVIDATTGIGPVTERAYEYAEKLNLPFMLFVNKLGKENAKFDKMLEEAKKIFGGKVVPITFPIGEGTQLKEVRDTTKDDSPYHDELIEAVAETDDALTEKYLTEETITEEEISKGLKEGTKSKKLIPLLAGDALLNKGVDLLLNAIVDYMPSPLDRNPKDSLAAFVFKTMVDPHLGETRYVRVFSGTLEAGSEVLNSTRKVSEKINQIYVPKGKEREEVRELVTGSIGILVKLRNTHTGDTLSAKTEPIVLEPIKFPVPQESVAIVPKTKKDEEKVSNGLTKLSEEDPSFSYGYDPEAKQTILKGLGELHLDVIFSRLKRRFGVEIMTERPKIHYREYITNTVESQGKYKRQTGGHGQYGDCWVRFEPLPIGSGFEFVNKITGGVIPARFIPSVEKGIREAMEAGLIAGYPLIDMRVTLYDGSFHPVDSSDIAFKIAGSLALKNAKEKLCPVILEPMLEVEVTVPEEFMGDVMGDLNARRGRVQGTESVGKYQKIKAIVPEAEMYRYSSALRSMTQGRGSFTQKFLRYEQVPKEIQDRIVEACKREKEE